MIVLIGGEKGGTGKTTIAVNLACIAAKEGADLVVVDSDPQQSASRFFATRLENEIEPYITCIEKRGRSLAKDLQSLSGKYELIIVDAGGQDNPNLRYAMGIADELYMPVQPNQFDLWTLDKMDEMIEEARIYNTGLSTRSVLNRCSSNPKNTDAQEAREVMESYTNLVPLKIALKDRVSYARVIRSGQCVAEFGKDNAASVEIQNLYKEVFYG